MYLDYNMINDINICDLNTTYTNLTFIWQEKLRKQDKLIRRWIRKKEVIESKGYV